ncbi:ATP-binding protein [Puniceicoccus vermicola]|uniref:histidine kinase n=1 Tax=Puniceicoccus vermicola TaxID=388746 RepID=A0A7X1E6F6_9BACT|nr:ATP-binding protein [Puniceicoccus vermicola]MBC2604053.1 response regulator [Puniceicoccus vermicola]
MASKNDKDPKPVNSPAEREVFIHDLKNIMTGALGHLSLARRRAPRDPVLTDSLSAVENILRGACSMAEKAIRPVESSVPQDLSVLDVLSASVGICVPPEGYSLNLTYGENLPMVRAQLSKLQQLFNNLLTNSVHAMEKGGKISIHLEQELPARREDDPKILRVRVIDTGEGIPEELQDKIFEDGFSTREGGTGLGLASARDWLEQIGGEILLEDDSSGRTCFVVRLPGIDEVDPRTRPAVPVVKGSSGRALVLDDDDMVLQIVEEMLSHLGWDVVTSNNGTETVEKYRTAKEEGNPFQFVILDLNMPKGISGPEAAEIIREYDPDARLYISSGQTTTIVNDPAEYGFSGSLKKPYTLDELSRIVAG